MMRWLRAFGMMLAVTLVACGTGPAPTPPVATSTSSSPTQPPAPTATVAAPTSTPKPTAVPMRYAASQGGFYFLTWSAVPYPGQSSNETVWVQLCADDGCVRPEANVPVHTVWNYRTSTPTLDWQTSTDGKAAMIRNVSDATCGYTVRVDIFVFPEQTQIDSAYFTPCGNGSAPQQPPPPSPTPKPVSEGPVSGSGNACPAGYPVKANDNSGIYHVPGQQFYNATNARNCFANPAAAERAGYRASKV